MGIAYTEHAPGAGLADAVRRYWMIRSTGHADAAEAIPNRVLPDNCIDVIFDLRPVGAEAAIVVGPMLSAELFMVRGDVDMLGVRFAPGAATEFLDIKASDLTPSHVTAGDVWPDAASLTDRLQSSPVADRPRALADILLERRRPRRDAALARSAAAAAERSRGVLSVSALADALGVNERRLQRTFDGSVGIGPKQVLRVQRFRAAAAMLTARPASPWTERASIASIAAACGYADQAHLTREFTELAGIPPAAFRAERRLVGFVQD